MPSPETRSDDDITRARELAHQSYQNIMTTLGESEFGYGGKTSTVEDIAQLLGFDLLEKEN